MNKPVIQSAILSLLTTAVGVLHAADVSSGLSGVTPNAQLDPMVGQPVDIAPWAYVWRADRAVQAQPEAYFIPRRLERMDKVYRTAYHAMSARELKGDYGQNVPGLLNPLLQKPNSPLQTGLLWVGKLSDYRVELHWPTSGQQVPAPEAVEVRAYSAHYGWFGWTVDEVLSKPQVSADRHTWVYKGGCPTEMIAVFYDGTNSTPPAVRVISPNQGRWKRMDVEIEWGFQPGTEKAAFDAKLETYVAMGGSAAPLAEDKGTRVVDGNGWQSRAAGGGRRGITVPLLYTPSGRSGLDSRVTVRTKTSGFTFRINDLEKGPILIPEHGVFITKAGSGQTARQLAQELAAKNLKSLRQMVREHREAASWEEVMRTIRLSTCPPGTELKPFPKVPDPPMQVELPDAGWTAAWRAATNQLRGAHMWGGLAFEVGRVAHEMNMIGLHGEADKVYEHFLKSPGVKSDGDYADGKGALEWATNMKHDMGYSHDGTHASTGRLLFAMADRFFLTGDREWFQRNRPRLQAAADWIIRQRTLYLTNIPNRQDLVVAGLMPPCMLGDYGLPSCDWHWYYSDNAYALQGLQRFADALAQFDPEAGRKYAAEAKAFREDLRRSVDRETLLAPVRRGHDGLYHNFIPTMAYGRGELLAMELGSYQRPQGDAIVGGLPLAEPLVALDANDSRMVSTLDLMEEVATLPKVTTYLVTGYVDGVLYFVGKTLKQLAGMEFFDGAALKLDEKWFWNSHGAGLAKASHNANIFLLQDDVPNFLRFWMNAYAPLVGADGKLWEWGCLGQYTKCEYPDNGSAGWFMEQFRNLLAMEAGQSLWVARATPRAWLKQGQRISVKNAATYFGALAYEIISDVDHGHISATVEIPNRNPPQSVLIRFRHPTAAPIKSVTVNGKAWTDFDPVKEIVRLHDVRGSVNVQAAY
jgi:hypothetical protein